MTGKVADAVMVVRNGEQIVRKYQPVVSNPSTAKQVAVRAKLKLLSQLAAVFADVIAFRKVGNVSRRNIFTKKNYSLVTYASDKAEFPYMNIDLTGGQLFFGDVTVTPTAAQNKVTVDIVEASGFDKHTIALFRIENDEFRQIGIQRVDGDVVSVDFSTPVPAAATFMAVAYGTRLNNDSARARYNDIVANVTPADVELEVERQLNENDYTLSETSVATATVQP